MTTTHPPRVLPGFAPDSKLRMLMQLSDHAEIVIVISAGDIEKNKVRGDLGITDDIDVLRLIDSFRGRGSSCWQRCHHRVFRPEQRPEIQREAGKTGHQRFICTILSRDIQVIFRSIVSDEGYGKNQYIETTKPLVVVTAPGPGSGKMATCLSQLYHEHKKQLRHGYAKFETFPIWNIPQASGKSGI